MNIFQTKRTVVKLAKNKKEHIDFFHALWNNPEVMKNVGFPEGLGISKEEISKILAKDDKKIFDKRLVIELKETGEFIGECKMGTPNEEGISDFDLKLLPQYWGLKLSSEIMPELIDQIFNRCDCDCIEGSPNINNVPSQKMQEKVGFKKIKKDIFIFTKKMNCKTEDVTYYLMRLYRKDWEAQ